MWPSATNARSSSRNDSAGGSIMGLRVASPASAGGRVAASHVASVPPIDRPATTARSWRAARLAHASSTAAVQSPHRRASRSSTVVPWPGRRGTSTSKPAPARAAANPSTLWGVLV